MCRWMSGEDIDKFGSKISWYISDLAISSLYDSCIYNLMKFSAIHCSSAGCESQWRHIRQPPSFRLRLAVHWHPLNGFFQKAVNIFFNSLLLNGVFVSRTSVRAAMKKLRVILTQLSCSRLNSYQSRLNVDVTLGICCMKWVSAKLYQPTYLIPSVSLSGPNVTKKLSTYRRFYIYHIEFDGRFSHVVRLPMTAGSVIKAFR